MLANFTHARTLNDHLRRGFAIGLLAAAALYGLASAPAEATDEGRGGMRPPIIRPPMVTPPRTGIEGARDSRATVEEQQAERLGARWAKIFAQLNKNTAKFIKSTYKWGFKNTNQTFFSLYVSDLSWQAMEGVAKKLKGCDVEGAKKVLKRFNSDFQKFWYGRVDRRNSGSEYGTSKAGKTEAKADEAAQRNVLDKLFREIKKAGAICLEAKKSKSPGNR